MELFAFHSRRSRDGRSFENKLPSTLLRATSVAVKPPKQVGIPTFELDAQNEDLSCLGEEMVALDGKTGKRSSALQGLTVDDEGLSVLCPTTSLVSFRTASTELYVPPPHSKGKSAQDGCVSSVKYDLQNAKSSSPVQKVEPCIRDKTGRRPESNKINSKKRKRSQTEEATADVEAAIGRVISAAEAIVVGHLIDASNLSLGQDRSIILEAALSLGKARHFCGLDKYDLDARTKDFGDLEIHDLDHESMQEAYADVGMIVDVPEDERQLLGIGMEVVNLSEQNVEVRAGARCSGRRCPIEVGSSPQSIGEAISDVCKETAQNCKSVKDTSSMSDLHPGPIVAQWSEYGGLQRNERTGDNVQIHSFGMQEVKEPAGNPQLHDGNFTIEISNPLNVDGLILQGKVKEPSPSWKSVAVVSSDSEAGIGENVARDHDIKIGNNQQDTEVLQEADAAVTESKAVGVCATEVMECQQNAEPPAVLLSTTSHTLEGGSSQVNDDTVKKGKAVPTQIEQITCWPEENSEKTVTQAPNADLVITDRSPNSQMFCGDFLLQTGSILESIQLKTEHQEEVEGEEAMCMDKGVTDNNVTQSLESSELHVELSLPSKALASSGTKWRHPDVGKSPVILSDPSMENAARTFVTPYVSRWFGGWSSNAALHPTAAVAIERNADVERFSSRSLNDIGSEDAVPEQNAFLARQKSASVGQETAAFHRVSVDEAVVVCLPHNDDVTSEKPKSDSSHSEGSHSQALDMSQIDPLCSFVPCSISAPAAVSLLPCHGDHQSSMLAATLEACAWTAMNIIDSRKVVSCQKARGAIGLESVLDPAVRIENEASSEQILETRIDPVSPHDATVKRMPTLMRKFSTTTNSLSLLLHAVDIAGKSYPNDRTLECGNQERPSTRSPNVTSRSPPVGFEGMERELDQSTDDDNQTTDLPGVTSNDSGKSVLKKKRMLHPDPSLRADLSDSPPLLWPRGKKRRLTASRVIDSDTTEWLHDYGDDHHMLHKDFLDKDENTLQNVTQQSGRLILRISTRSKSCHEPKILFKGLQFVLTGLSSQNKEKLSKIIERCGGELLADVPAFSPKQRFKRRGVDCGARSPPIVIAPQQMRTSKYLYGCAVGSPLLNASWINASVSAVKCLPYHQYQHKQTRAGCILQTNIGCVSKSSESPLFVGFQFLFHGQQDFISQLSTLAKHAGGKVIRKLVLNKSEQKQGHKLVGLVVVEGSNNLPLELQRAASKQEYDIVVGSLVPPSSHLKAPLCMDVVIAGKQNALIFQQVFEDSEWMIVSLLNGKILPFPTNSTPPSHVLPSQQSSASKNGESLQRYSRRRVQFQSENLESREDGSSGIELLVKKLKHRSLPDENQPSHSSARAKSGGKESEEQGHVNICWLGKGFTSPPQVPQLTDRLLGPYSHSLAHKKVPKKFLYYEGFLCNGVEYFLGDIVEVRASAADCPSSVARIEGLWSEEDSRRLPQTRAFQQGVRKRAYKNVLLKCRRFYRPSDTGFPGQQDSSTTHELYLSNHIDKNVKASNIVRRIRLKLEIAHEVVHCKNWYDDDDDDDDVGDQERAAGSSICHKKGTTTATRAPNYFCSFFYDHVGESLHRIKLDV